MVSIRDENEAGQAAMINAFSTRAPMSTLCCDK